MTYILHHMDCMEWLDEQPENSFEAIITDPPYGLKEYSFYEQTKLRAGNGGGIWRIPPTLDGIKRAPLPRFTVLSDGDLKTLYQCFFSWGRGKNFGPLYGWRLDDSRCRIRWLYKRRSGT